jgi:transcriptional regulator with XRE-family HTH domain
MSNVANLPTPRRNHGAEIVASNVRGLLGYHGRTQAQLANALGVSEMYISRRASGSTEFKASEIFEVAKYFGVKPGSLLEEREGGLDERALDYGSAVPARIVSLDAFRTLRDAHSSAI